MLKYSVPVRNARLGSMAAVIGASPSLLLYSGAEPADTSTPATGTLLATIVLPATFLGTPSGGAILKAGTWAGTIAVSGNLGYFRLDQGGTCTVQGKIGIVGDVTADMEVPSTLAVTAGQGFGVNSFQIVDSNG